MRISIRITLNDENFSREYIEREIEVVIPDNSADLFGQIKFGALVEEHLANAIEDYAKAVAAPVATGPLDQEVLQVEALEQVS